MKRKACGIFMAALLVLASGGCAGEGAKEQEAMGAETPEETRTPVIGLVLSSMDGEENEELIESFERAAEDVGAELTVKVPEVTQEEAAQARAVSGSFILYEVDPIELQMLLINELVAEDADVIAIYPNHSDAMEGVLAAARSVGIRVCAFGTKVNDRSCDVYTEQEEASEAAVALLEE